MYTVKDLVRHCKERGYAVTRKNTLSRIIGDGILQQIFYGEKDSIHVGITSMYGDLPDMFWASKVPFTFFSVENLHGAASPRFDDEFDKEKDIRLLLDGGLDILDTITTQDRLIKFSLASHQAESTTACHVSVSLWGAYWICGMHHQLMYEVCCYYTDLCEGFRRSKDAETLIEQNRYEEFFLKWKQTKQVQFQKIAELWHALVTDNEIIMNAYVQSNYSKNMWQVSKEKIPTIMTE